jgi:hypothetical protein
MGIVPLIRLPNISATAVSRRIPLHRDPALAMSAGAPGSVEIEPSVLLPVGGNDTLAFLSCTT